MRSKGAAPDFWEARNLADEGRQLFVPRPFCFPDREAMLALISDYPLAQLFTAAGGRHRVTASPIIPAPRGEGRENLYLLGHMARRNPQVADIEAGAEATAVFSAPGAYISPRWFRVTHTAPTWNYQSVQVRGVLEPIPDEAGVTDVLRRTIARLEARAHPEPSEPQWTLDQLPGERSAFLRDNVAAFRLRVTGMEGIQRLNQDKQHEDIQAIMAGLARSPQPGASTVLRAMAQQLADAPATP